MADMYKRNIRNQRMKDSSDRKIALGLVFQVEKYLIRKNQKKRNNLCYLKYNEEKQERMRKQMEEVKSILGVQ